MAASGDSAVSRLEAVEPSAPVTEAEIVEESPEAAFEPPVDIETLPLSEDDPVLEAEIETAGGPASDDAEELTRDDAVTEPVEVEVAIPSSVPSGHLPHKGGEQMQAASTSDDVPAAIEVAETISAEKPAESKETIAASDEAETAESTAEAVSPADDVESEASDITTTETLERDTESEPSTLPPPVGEMPGRAEGVKPQPSAKTSRPKIPTQ